MRSSPRQALYASIRGTDSHSAMKHSRTVEERRRNPSTASQALRVVLGPTALFSAMRRSFEGPCWAEVAGRRSAAFQMLAHLGVPHPSRSLLRPGWESSSCYSFRRYASNASRSSSFMNPRSRSVPFDEMIGGILGGGFSRAARLNKAT